MRRNPSLCLIAFLLFKLLKPCCCLLVINVLHLVATSTSPSPLERTNNALLVTTAYTDLVLPSLETDLLDHVGN